MVTRIDLNPPLEKEVEVVTDEGSIMINLLDLLDKRGIRQIVFGRRRGQAISTIIHVSVELSGKPKSNMFVGGVAFDINWDNTLARGSNMGEIQLP